jgi:hypothetical protein
MSKPAKPSKHPIVTEGKNDAYVFYHLFAHHSVPEGVVDFRAYDGIERLLEALPNQLRESELERIGIVVDANSKLEDRWRAVCHRLALAGYKNVPSLPVAEGTIIEESLLPIAGIWLMPNNQLPGMLEDFVGFLVPQGDPLWNRAGECLNGIPAEHRRFYDVNRSKAHIHTWLAWQDEPGTPLGSAITKRYLDADAAHAKLLMDWVRRLFNLPAKEEN